MKNNEPHYTLEVTRGQLRILRDACELLTRCRMGQIAEAGRQTLNERGVPGANYIECQDAEEIIKRANGLAPHASWGVGKFKAIDEPFEIHQVLRHRLAWDRAIEEGLTQSEAVRDWGKMMSVDYDEPLLVSGEPPVKVEKVT
jgi:hypothetical protein